MRTKFCPKCKSRNIWPVAERLFGFYNCKFRSLIFPEKTNINKIKNAKHKK